MLCIPEWVGHMINQSIQIITCNHKCTVILYVKVSALVPLEGCRGLILLSGDPTIGIGKSLEHNRLPYHYDISVVIHTDRRTDI